MRRLRICHIASGDLWAGAEVQMSGLLQELKVFPDLELSAVLLNGGRLFEELVVMGIPVTIYDEARLNAWQILTSLRAYFSEWRPDVVHTQRYKENILGGIAAQFSATPVVIQTIHGLQERLSGRRHGKMTLYSWLNNMVTRRTAQTIVGVSEEIRDLLRRKFPKTEVVCIHNGIDVRKVLPSVSGEVMRKELCIPEKALVIGTVCRLTPVKGIEYLLQAVSRLCVDRNLKPMKLIIVGDGPLRLKLEGFAAELGIGQDTLFLGVRNDVYDLMNLFDIFVLPSLHEGVPMALLEALALGCPVVASRVGGIPEVLEDMVGGRLVPAQDVWALGEAIKKLALSRELRERLGKVGRERVTQYYDGKNMASQVRELYRRSANRSSR